MFKVKPKGFLALAFLIMIGLVPLFYLASVPFPRVNSMTEGRVLKQFSLQGLGFKSALDVFRDGDKLQAGKMLLKLFRERALPAQIERATSDQFPLRDQFIQITYAFGRGLNELVYWRSPMPAIPATILPDQGVYITRDKQYLFYGNSTYNPSLNARIDVRIANYKTLIELYPQVNWYVYNIDGISTSKANPLNDYHLNADEGRAFQYFLDNKPEALTVDNFQMESFENHKEYFYRTDGHWNIHGVLFGYDEIHTVLSKHFPEISTKRVYEDFITFPDLFFRGELRRQSMYLLEGELFEMVDYQLPPHKTYANGKETTYGRYAEYFAGNYSNEPFVNHYGQFFGPNVALLEFVYEGNTDRDILIFGNSFDNPLVPLIAQHYNHTYSVDPRSYGDFSLGEFLQDHPVDDILLVGSNDLPFLDPNRIINP